MREMKTTQVAPRSTSSCAACKFLKRRCTAGCLFAPYFRSDESKKFAKVHKVFGASNVAKILAEVPEDRREDAVNSLVYQAEVRLSDPVYGCIGAIALLQQRMIQLQQDLAIARSKLANCVANNIAATARSTDDNHFCRSNSQNIFAAAGVGGGGGVGGCDHGSSSSLFGFGDGFDWSLLESDHISLTDEFGQIPFP